MACNEYVPGAVVYIQVLITDKAGALVDPTNVQFRLLKHGSVAPTYDTDYTYPADPEVVKEGTGTYSINQVVDDTPGLWKYKWSSDSPAQAAEEGSFQVLATDFD